MSPEPGPAAVPFDPGAKTLPATLRNALTSPDSSIVLLVAPDTGDAVIRSVVAMAEALADAGHATVLADASVREPRLHTLLDVENLEGLADIFLFGASLERVRTRPPGHDFDFVPVGAYVPDEDAILHPRRWLAIAESLNQEGTRLLLFVPAQTAGLGLLSKRVGRAVLIGDPRGVERAAEKLDPSCEIAAVVEPVGALGPEALSAVAGEGRGEGSTIFDEPELTEPVVFRSDQKSRRAVSPILLVLLLAALVVAGWFAYSRYLTEPAPAVGSAQAAPVGAADADPGPPMETPLPVSVAVEAHQDFESAVERTEALDSAVGGVDFFLAPVAVRDVVYYRLLAGPVSSRAAGEALMARLVEAGHKTAADPWAVQQTSQAFLFGAYDTRSAAAERVDSLASLEIPAYVVPVRFESGQRRFRVYGGAYESRGEASVMREMLVEAGIEAELVRRTGEPAEGP